MALVQDDLGSDVLRRAAEGPRLPAELQLLGEPEVDQLDVAPRLQQQVLRLQVSVDDVTRVQVVERFQDAGRVEPGRRVVEVASIPEKTKDSQ